VIKPSKTKRTSKSTVVEKPKTGSKPNALQQPLQPSKELAAVVGNEAIVTFWAAECCTIGRTTWRSACRFAYDFEQIVRLPHVRERLEPFCGVLRARIAE